LARKKEVRFIKTGGKNLLLGEKKDLNLYFCDAEIVGMRMKMIFPLMICILLQGVVWSRTWTDASGKKMEAEIVRADTTNVTVNKAGKEFTIALEKLSEGDREFVSEWLEEQEDEDSKPTAGDSGNGGTDQFDGKPLTKGGKVNLYEYEYDAETLERVQKKHKGTDTGYRLAIAVPADFDPSKPQNVFIANTAVNNDAEGKRGNTGAIGMYAKDCVDAGWVCLAYDSNIGRSNNNTDIYCAFSLLNKVWPKSKEWSFAVGGFSGGAKACFDPCGYLIKHEYNAVGALLMGCNEDRSGKGKDRYKASSSGYRKLKVFLSTGDKDNLVSEASVKAVISSLKSNGIKNIKSESYSGGHSFNKPHIAEALKWFTSTEK
jgi:hypothetical protein